MRRELAPGALVVASVVAAVTLGAASAGAVEPPDAAELAQIEEAVEAHEIRAMMAHRRRVRLVLEAAVGFNTETYITITTSDAMLKQYNSWVFSLRSGVRWGVIPALDLRATLGLTSPTPTTLWARSDGRCVAMGGSEQFPEVDVTAMTLGLMVSARARPSPRTPVYLGLGLGGTLLFSGGAVSSGSCIDRVSSSVLARSTTDLSAQVVPMFAWQLEYGAQFGAGERYDVGLRLSGLSSVGQEQNGGPTSFHVYFGGAI